MNEARESLARIDEWLARLREVAKKKTSKAQRPKAQRPATAFEDALDEDLNISAALGFLFESIRETNRAMDQNEMDAASASAWLDWWKRINTVLDLEADTETSFRTKSQSSHKNARAHGAKRIGNEATNCASKFSRSAGNFAIRKTGRNSPAVLAPSSGLHVYCSSNV